jgi:hypothetical protein
VRPKGESRREDCLLSQGPVFDGCWSTCNQLLRPPAGADLATRVATTGGRRGKQERGRRVGGGVCAVPCPSGYRTLGPIAYRSCDQVRAASVGCPGRETTHRLSPNGPSSMVLVSISEYNVANFSLFVGRSESRTLSSFPPPLTIRRDHCTLFTRFSNR